MVPSRTSRGSGWPPAHTVAVQRSSSWRSAEGDDRDVAAGLVLQEHVVDRGDDVARALRPGRGGPERVPGQRRHRGGLGALAAHVAHHHEPLAVAHLHGVVEVAAEVRPLAGGLEGGLELEAGDRRQGGRQQRALQRARHGHRLRLGLLGALLGEEQLLLVAAALGGVEHHRAHHQRRAVVGPLQHRVHQRRQAAAVRGDEVERHLAHGAVHLQRRGVVGLVVDPAAAGQQVDEALLPHELLAPSTRSR